MIYFLLCGWPCRLFSIEIERACSCPMGGRCISVGMKQEWCFVLIPSTQRTTSWLRSSWVWCPPPWAETWLPGHFLCDIIKAYPWQQKPKVVPFLFHAPYGVGRLKKSHFKHCWKSETWGQVSLFCRGESRFSKRLGQFSQGHMASEWRGGVPRWLTVESMCFQYTFQYLWCQAFA